MLGLAEGDAKADNRRAAKLNPSVSPVSSASKFYGEDIESLELEARTYAVLDEGVRESARQSMYSLQPGAMSRDDHLRVHLGQSIADKGYYWLEERSTEVESPDHRVDLLNSGELLGVAHDVDDSSVPAAGYHDEALSANVHDRRLIVEDKRVRFPFAVPLRLVEKRHPFLEGSRPINLSGDQ